MKKTTSKLMAFAFPVLMACGASTQSPAELSDTNPTATNQSSGSFALYEAKQFKDPSTGAYVVDGDISIADIKQLEEFYNTYVVANPGALIVDTKADGSDNKWAADQRKNLTYCVSKSFGTTRYNAVVQAMAEATAAWEAAADVAFQHDASKDSNCSKSTSGVIFNVVPVSVGGQYIAKSFFPDSPRAQREVDVDDSAFDPAASDQDGPNLTGVLRHELGHVIGFRHEHTRPEAGAQQCFEDDNWRSLTSYDKASVMHYPQCNGISSWALVLTDKDKAGAALLYGAPGTGGGGDNGGGDNGGDNGGGGTHTGPQQQEFQGSVAKKQFADLNGDAGFDVAPGTTFDVQMTGSGDPDLYVRFGSLPSTSAYSCRPYLSGPDESCHLTVPAGQTKAYVSVRGYKAGDFDVLVTWTAAN